MTHDRPIDTADHDGHARLLRRIVAPIVTAAGFFFAAAATPASAIPFATSEIDKYLVIATGEGKSGDEFESFNMQNVEIGADQELVSTSGNGSPTQVTGSLQDGSTPNLADVFIPTRGDPADGSGNDNRWSDIDSDHPDDVVGVPDVLPGARPLFEGRDFSGNVALTGAFAEFGSSNSDVHADIDIGIECNRSTVDACFPDPSSSNSFFDVDDPLNAQDLNAGAGISPGFDPSALVGDLEVARDFIVGLGTEFTINEAYRSTNLENNNIKDSGSPHVTDLDAIDANDDGIAVIDIDLGGDDTFLVNNTDWILESTQDTFAIVRMKRGTNFDFSNSSIMLGDGDDDSTNVIDELGAIFFMDAFKGTNEVFNLNNVIIGGIALWDLVDFNPNRTSLLDPALSSFDPTSPVNGFDRTVVNAGQNAQGCSQFISNQVLMSDARWNRCSFGGDDVEVTEPPVLHLLLVGGVGLLARRARRARRVVTLA